MKMGFRWYGPSDPVPLAYIRQIPGMRGIISAVYDVPVGEIWPVENIEQLKQEIEAHGFAFEVIESVPVHEDVKMGRPTRERLVDNFCASIRNLAQCGIKVVCYNFMPVFDWTRTVLDRRLDDGSTTLAYDRDAIAKMDPNALSLPGWDSSYKPGEVKSLLDGYRDIGEEELWENLVYFLKRVIPAAEEAGIKMAIHPDDPPRPVFGLPRIVKNRADLERLLAVVPSPSNGLTLCSGSLGADVGNDMVSIVREFAGRGLVHFAHMRNVEINATGNFTETAHLSACGSLDMAAIMLEYSLAGYDGYIRPDHGRMIWGESGKPGYGLYDRALGAMYLNGLWEGVAAARKGKERL